MDQVRIRDKITERQKEFLSAIYSHIASSGFPPSLAELREQMGIASNQAVLDMLATLERKGFIKREGGIARSIRILQSGCVAIGKPPLIPVRGTSYGGTLTETYELLGEWRPLSPELHAMTDRCSFVRVSGDSMVGAGITNGCFVLVKDEHEFTCNDIVLAQTPNGETTIKRYVTQDHPPYVFLQPDPEGAGYPIIPCGPDTELVGRVIAVVRDGNPIINVNR